MPTERCQVLSSLAVPQFDTLVEAGRHKVETVWAEGYLDNQCLVTSHSCQALLLLLGLPHVHRKVIRATHQDLSSCIE